MATHYVEQLLELTSLLHTSTGREAWQTPAGPRLPETRGTGRERGAVESGLLPGRGRRGARPRGPRRARGVQAHAGRPAVGSRAGHLPEPGLKTHGLAGAVGARQHPGRRAGSLLKQVGAQREAAEPASARPEPAPAGTSAGQAVRRKPAWARAASERRGQPPRAPGRPR